MQNILDAILNDAPAEEFASIEIPESYQAQGGRGHVRRAEDPREGPAQVAAPR